MALRLLYVVLVILFSSTASAQQIYKWKDLKDGKGQWHFSNFPPPGIAVEKVRGTEITPKSSQTLSVESEVKEKSEATGGGEKALTPAKQLAEEKARKQKKYKKRLDELTRQMKTLRNRYAVASKEWHKGKGGYQTKVPLVSRSFMVQHWPHTAITSDRKRSEMTKQLEKLHEKREKLIREMRQKGFDTGYIPY